MADPPPSCDTRNRRVRDRLSTTDLGAAVLRLRRVHGLTQKQLAERAGMHRTYVAGIERGERNPTFTALVRLAAALDISTSALVAEAEHEQDAPSG